MSGIASQKHWSYGSGSAGYMYDNGPCYTESKASAIESALCIFRDELTGDEYAAAEADLDADCIHYFPAARRSHIGADYVEVTEQDGPCPDSDD